MPGETGGRERHPIGPHNPLRGRRKRSITSPATVAVVPPPCPAIRAEQVPRRHVVAQSLPQEPLRTGAEELARMALECELEHLAVEERQQGAHPKG